MQGLDELMRELKPLDIVKAASGEGGSGIKRNDQVWMHGKQLCTCLACYVQYCIIMRCSVVVIYVYITCLLYNYLFCIM